MINEQHNQIFKSQLRGRDPINNKIGSGQCGCTINGCPWFAEAAAHGGDYEIDLTLDRCGVFLSHVLAPCAYPMSISRSSLVPKGRAHDVIYDY